MNNIKYWLFFTKNGRITTAATISIIIGTYFFLMQETLQERVERAAHAELDQATVVTYISKDEKKFKVDFPEFPNFIRCRTDLSDEIIGKDVNAYFSQTECMTEPNGCVIVDRETKQVLKCGGFGDVGKETGDMCSDNEDNDGNGKIDCHDPSCSGVGNCRKENDCSNKQDDDEDGTIDCRDADCSEYPECSVKRAEILTVNAVDMNVCPGFSRNEQEYKYETSLFHPVLVTPQTNMFGAELLSVDEGVLTPFDLDSSNQINCCSGSKSENGCSITMTKNSGCIQGYSNVEYAVCATISSNAKINFLSDNTSNNLDSYPVRPDDILVNALYYKLLQRYSNDSTKVANTLCKVPTSKVEHFANVYAVITESNINHLPRNTEYIANDLKEAIKFFIDQNPKQNLCFIFNKLDYSFLPSAMSYFVNAPYQTSTSISDARVSSLFQKLYTNSRDLKKFKNWASFATDMQNAFVDTWYYGVQSALKTPTGEQLKPSTEGVTREQIAKTSKGSGGFVADSLEQLRCVGDCVQEEIDFAEMATVQEVRSNIDRCKNQTQGCCTFFNVMNPSTFLGEGRSLPEERDPSILGLFTYASTSQTQNNSQCVAHLYRIITESTEIRKALLQKFDEIRGVPNQGREEGTNVRMGGLLPSNIEIAVGQSLRNSKPLLKFPEAQELTEECPQLILAWDQNTPALRSIAQTIKTLVNEKDGPITLTTPQQGIDLKSEEQFDILLAMQPYYTTRSLPSVGNFLITDPTVGRNRFPFGDDDIGVCGALMCDAYRKMAFRGFIGNEDEKLRFIKQYEKCTGSNILSNERQFYLEKCEEYYQQSKTPILILDYYVPYVFSVGPNCQ